MKELTASEALFGFAGWLTCRDQEAVFSAKHDAGPAAELVAEFIKANNLSDPADDFGSRLVLPSITLLEEV